MKITQTRPKMGVECASHCTCDKLVQSCIGSSSFPSRGFPGGRAYFISPRIGRTYPGPPPEAEGLDQNLGFRCQVFGLWMNEFFSLVAEGEQDPIRIIGTSPVKSRFPDLISDRNRLFWGLYHRHRVLDSGRDPRQKMCQNQAILLIQFQAL